MLRAAAGSRSQLVTAAAISLLIHFLLFYIVVQGGYWQGSLLSASRAAPAGTLNVVLMPAERILLPAPPIEDFSADVTLPPALSVVDDLAVPAVESVTMEAGATEPPPAPPALGIIEPYFTSQELDSLPQVKEQINPYMDQFDRVAQRGELVLRLWIDQLGQVENIEVIKNNLPDDVVELAIQRFKTASYIPAKKDGREVKSRVDAVLRFDFE